MRMRTALAGVFIALSSLVWATQQGPSAAIEDQLDRARQLSITAPWSESEAVLEELETLLSEATPEQRAEFRLIRARNQTLAGNMKASLEQLELGVERLRQFVESS